MSVVETPTPTMPSVRSVRRWMRGLRRRHATQSWGDTATTIYIGIFGVVLFGAMVVSVLRNVDLTAQACPTRGCATVRASAPLIALLGFGGLWLRVLMTIGPLSASRATASWLLSAPLSRRTLLLPRTVLLVVFAALFGLVPMVFGWALFSASAVAIAVSTVLCAGWSVLLASVAVAAQERPGFRRPASVLADVLVLLAAVPLVLVAVDRPITHAWLNRDGGGGALLVGLALVAGALALVAVVLLVRGLSRLARPTLTSSGEVLAGMTGAAQSLDPALISDIVRARRWAGRSRLRSARGRGSGIWSLAYRELRRSLRSPRRYVTAAVLVLAPYAAVGAGAPRVIVVLVTLLGCWIAVQPFSDGLRTMFRSSGLQRMLPFSPTDVRLAMSAVPALIAVAWILAVAAAVRNPVALFAIVLATVAGTVRRAAAPPPSYDGALVATPAGALPPGLMTRPIRGVDAMLLAALPAVLGAPGWLVVALPIVVVAFILAGPMDDAERRRQQGALSGQSLGDQLREARGQGQGGRSRN